MISTGDKDLVVSHDHGVDYYPRSGTTFSTVMPVQGERFMYSVGSHPADFDGDEVEDVVTHSRTKNFTCFVQDIDDGYEVRRLHPSPGRHGDCRCTLKLLVACPAKRATL